MAKRKQKPYGGPTDAQLAEIDELAKVYMHIPPIAAKMGIVTRTIYDWMRTGARELRSRDKGNPPDPHKDRHIKLLHSIQNGRAEAEKLHLENIKKSSDNGAWQASAWVLERGIPDRWGRDTHRVKELEAQLKELEKLVLRKDTAEDS